jgi:hypothetical protein
MSLSPLITFGLLAINTLALIVSLCVLLLSLWQPPQTAFGRTLSLFLASQALLNITAIVTLLNRLLTNFLPDLGVTNSIGPVLANISLASLLLNVLAAYGLIVTAAGQMKQALLVIGRGGLLGLGLLLWPLWNGKMFQVGDDMATFAPAGLVSAALAIIFIVLGLYMAWAYRRQIRQTGLLISLSILLCGQLLTLVVPALRVVDFASLLTALVGSVLGYNLARAQIFDPMTLRASQISSALDLVHRAQAHEELTATLDWSIEQVRQLVHADVAMILLMANDNSHQLVVAAQAINPRQSMPSYIGRKLSIGESLAGRAYQTQQPLSIANYHEWNGRSIIFDNPPLYAGLSVPLVDGGAAIGALSVYQMQPGRVFSERDQAAVELLAAQIALTIAFSQALQTMAMNSSNTAAAMISHVVHNHPLHGHALAINIDSELPPLTLPVQTLAKMIEETLDQVVKNSAVTEAVQVLVHAEGETILIEVGHGSLFIQQAPDRVLIKLEPNTPHVTH